MDLEPAGDRNGAADKPVGRGAFIAQRHVGRRNVRAHGGRARPRRGDLDCTDAVVLGDCIARPH